MVLLKSPHGVFVISEVHLRANKDDGGAGAVVTHFRVPLCGVAIQCVRMEVLHLLLQALTFALTFS